VEDDIKGLMDKSEFLVKLIEAQASEGNSNDGELGFLKQVLKVIDIMVDDK
jgi:uncharacterized protein YggU (UPF0235/DUF167 family)